MEEFRVPERAADAWIDRDAARGEEEADAGQIAELADDICIRMCAEDPTAVIEPRLFSPLARVLRHPELLPARQHAALADALASSLSCLVVRADGRLSARSGENAWTARERSVARGAVSTLVCALDSLTGSSDGGAPGSWSGAGGAVDTSKPRGKKRGPSSAAVAGGDVLVGSLRSALPSLAATAELDVRALFAPREPDTNLTLALARIALRAVELEAAGRDGTLLRAAGRCLAGVARLDGCGGVGVRGGAATTARAEGGEGESAGTPGEALGSPRERDAAAEVPPLPRAPACEHVAAEVLRLVLKLPHAAKPAAELLAMASTPSLAGWCVRELAEVPAAEWERLQSAPGDRAGVRGAAAFVEELARAAPAVTLATLDTLVPLLGVRAHSLRSGVVSALALALVAIQRDSGAGSGPEAQGEELGEEIEGGGRDATAPLASLGGPGPAAGRAAAAARARTRQALLQTLLERTRDSSVYARKAAVAAWTSLADGWAVPLGHWSAATEVACTRLRDRSPLVRREAARLLRALLRSNPFGPDVHPTRLEATLAALEGMLRGLGLPVGGAEAAKEAGDAGDQNEGEARDGTEEGASADVASPLRIKAERVEGVGDGGASSAPASPEGPPASAPPLDPSTVGWDGTVGELRTALANVRLGLSFSQALSTSLTSVRRLLASPTASDAQEACLLLLQASAFRVKGAGPAARSALPLVLAREPTTREAARSLLAGTLLASPDGGPADAADAAGALAALGASCHGGEAEALTELVTGLCASGELGGAVVRELWGIVSSGGDGSAEGAPPAPPPSGPVQLAPPPRSRAVARRGALSVLSAVATAGPAGAGLFSVADVEALCEVVAADSDPATSRAAAEAIAGLLSEPPAATVPRGPPAQVDAQERLGDPGLRTRAASALVGSLLRPPAGPRSRATGWFAVADSALRAAFAIHESPDALAGGVLAELRARLAEEPAPEAPLTAAKVLFLSSHAAMLQLAAIEDARRAARRRSADGGQEASASTVDGAASTAVAEPSLTTAPAEAGAPGDSELAAAVAAAADATLEAAAETAERELLRDGSAMAADARLAASLVSRRGALASLPPALAGAALLAAAKFSLADEGYAAQVLPGIKAASGWWETAEAEEAGGETGTPAPVPRVPGAVSPDDGAREPGVRDAGADAAPRPAAPALPAALRRSLAVACADVAARWPRAAGGGSGASELARGSLRDPDASVRAGGAGALARLLLVDAVRGRDAVAALAAAAADEAEPVRRPGLAYFAELAARETRNSSPLHAALPDAIAGLAADPRVPPSRAREASASLLRGLAVDRRGDEVAARLAARVEGAASDPRALGTLVFALAHAPLGERAARAAAEPRAARALALACAADPGLRGLLGAVIQRARRGASRDEVRGVVDALEAALVAAIAEEATAGRAVEGEETVAPTGGGAEGDAASAGARSRVEGRGTASPADADVPGVASPAGAREPRGIKQEPGAATAGLPSPSALAEGLGRLSFGDKGAPAPEPETDAAIPAVRVKREGGR